MVHRENIRQICFEDKYGYTTETETRQVQGYKGLISVERTNVESGEKATTHTRWAPTSYKCYIAADWNLECVFGTAGFGS